MRPPICDVCEADVDPAEPGSLVSCVREPGRADETRTVGHPEHQLWLCGAHHEQGAALAVSGTARQVVAALREHPEQKVPVLPVGDSAGATVVVVVECAPIEIGEVARVLRRALDRLAAENGLADVTPESTERRDWNPMDNVLPPESPYVDYRWRRIARGDLELALAEQYAHWNPDELARASATLSVRSPTGAFSVAAHTPSSGGDALVRQLFVQRDAPPWLLEEFEAHLAR